MNTMEIRLKVNGDRKQLTIAPGDLLLDVLRREGYFGVKRGCETGECGACTVLVNGKPINSCLMFAAQTEGSEILTIEGVEQNGKLDPIQEAFLEHGAVQCGYCTPGMIIGGHALLQETPKPTREQISNAMEGHLCRCGAHGRIVDAIEAASHMPASGGAK